MSLKCSVCRQCGERLQINTKRTECWVPESSATLALAVRTSWNIYEVSLNA